MRNTALVVAAALLNGCAQAPNAGTAGWEPARPAMHDGAGAPAEIKPASADLMSSRPAELEQAATAANATAAPAVQEAERPWSSRIRWRNGVMEIDEADWPVIVPDDAYLGPPFCSGHEPPGEHQFVLPAHGPDGKPLAPAKPQFRMLAEGRVDHGPYAGLHYAAWEVTPQRTRLLIHDSRQKEAFAEIRGETLKLILLHGLPNDEAELRRILRERPGEQR